MSNIKQFPLTLRMINVMLRDTVGTGYRKIESLELPSKFDARFAKAEIAAAAISGKRVGSFIKVLPMGLPRSELRRSAFNTVAAGDYDLIVAITKSVKHGKVLHALLDDAFEGEEGSVAQLIHNANIVS